MPDPNNTTQTAPAILADYGSQQPKNSDSLSFMSRAIRLTKKMLLLFPRHDQWQLVALTISLALAASIEMVGVGLVVPIIAVIDQPEIVQANVWLSWAYNFSGVSSVNGFVLWCCLVLIGFYLFKNILIALIMYWQSLFIARIEAQIGTRLLDNYLSMPYTLFLKRNPSQMVSNITIETTNLFAGFVKPAFIVLSDLFVVCAILILLIYVAPMATLAAIGALGISGGLFYFILRRPLLKLGRERQYHRNKMLQWTNQSLGSLKELIVLGRKNYFKDRFWQHAKAMITTQTFYETTIQMPRLVIETIGVVTLLLVTIIMLNQQANFLPTLSLFAMAAFRMMPSINRITTCAAKVRYYVQTLHSIHDDLALQTEQESPDNSHNTLAFNNQLSLSNIHYCYDGVEKPVFSGLNLSLNKGDSISITGASGGGKTTLVDIMLGLLCPSSGSVCVDGVNIHDNLRAWQNHISYMPQTVYLTDDTIRRNIAFGIPDEKIDQQRVQQAIEHAQLDDFIADQPNGLDTMVGERGVRMSGGQRQRIGIARALYNNPQLLILDEATTGLDPKTEKAICDTLSTMRDSLTMVIISHQPALAAIAKTKYTLENGQLISVVKKCK